MTPRRFALAASTLALLAAGFLLTQRSSAPHGPQPIVLPPAPAEPHQPFAVPVEEPSAPPAKEPPVRELTLAPAKRVAARNTVGNAWQSDPQPELAAFARWTERFLTAPAADQMAMIPEGLQLALSRRKVLAELIRSQPERALAAAVPMLVRAKLPTEITALLEERVAGRGELALNGATPAPGEALTETTFRSALIGGREYRAFTYGRRARGATLPEASIIGVALDGALAVLDSPLRALEAGETADGRVIENVCAISGITTPLVADAPLNTRDLTAVQVDDRIHVLCQPAHLTRYETQLIAQEHQHETVSAANNQPGTSGVVGRPTQAWTHGTKSVLIIRVDFSDKAGTPVNSLDGQAITEDYAVNRFNSASGVRDFYAQSSFGKAALAVAPTVASDSPDVTAVLRMPATAASYATSGNNALLHSDARNAATTAGFNVNNYDRIGVVFSSLGSIGGSQITYGGLGNIIGKNFWINGQFSFGIVAHEIGHTFGLYHANIWQVSDGNPVSPAGASVEYGDLFDIMGGGLGFTQQFSHWNKSILQWIPDTAVTTIATGGTYRVFRFDHQSANLANALALKIVRDRNRDFWIGHRRATNNPFLSTGAYIVWGYNENRGGDLLDMTTPNSNANDAALSIGSTFNDTAAGVTIQPLARGGSGADEWLDVQVSFQPRIQWAKSEFLADEQGGSAVLTLTRSSNSTGAVTVNFATTPGSATTPADFTAMSGSVTWPSGDMTPKTITIPVTVDALAEGTENFTVTLSGVTGGVVVDNPVAIVTIADPGANDPTFTADFVNSTVERVIIQPDGKLVIAGWFSSLQDTAFNTYTQRGIARLNSDGTLDLPFLLNGGGIAGSGSPRVHALARQADGKLIIGGSFSTVHGTARANVARLNADGSLDTTFDPGAGANDLVYAAVAQPDGKILIGGAFTSVNGVANRLLTRLNADGSVDGTFTPPTFGSGTGWRVESFALQADGKAIVGGSFYFSSGNQRGGLCRVTTTGALDAAFSGVVQGAHVVGNTSSIRSVEEIAVQLDGKILVAGDFTAFNNTARGGLARLSTAGALDAGFAPTSDGECAALLVQPDGRILVGGTFTTFNGSPADRIARLTSAGALDVSWNTANAADDTVEDFALQPDGKVVLAGSVFVNFQGSADNSPVWRFFAGLPGLPGTVQLGAEALTGIEGTSATITATRSGGSFGALSVNYATVPGTATAADFTAASGALSWADGDAAAKTFTVAITADAIVDSGEIFTVNLGPALIGSALLGSAQQATVNVTTAFGAWAASKFTPLELADTNISGDLADPDRDRLNNLLEFALNQEPKLAGATSLPTAAIQNIGGLDYLTLTFRRRAPALDLTYTPRTTATLGGSWNADAVLVGAPVINGDGTETVTFRDSVPRNSATQRFMRLEVTRTP